MEMRKVQTKPARKILKKPAACSAGARRASKRRADLEAVKVTQKRRRQANNVRSQAKKALQKGVTYTPKTNDAKLKKIAADVRRIDKKADTAIKTSNNANDNSHAAMDTAERCMRLVDITKNIAHRAHEVSGQNALRQIHTVRSVQAMEEHQAAFEERYERKSENIELRLQGFESKLAGRYSRDVSDVSLSSASS